MPRPLARCGPRVAAELLLALALASPALAQAPPEDAAAAEEPFYVDDPFTGARPWHLGVHAGVSHFGPGLAAGARVGIPLVDNGFISTLNNAVFLSVGADLYYTRYRTGAGQDDAGLGVGVPLTVHWEFYFPRRWSAYAELGLNVFLSPSLLRDGEGIEAGGWIAAAAGAVWRFADRAALELRLGNPYSAVGLRFDL